MTSVERTAYRVFPPLGDDACAVPLPLPTAVTNKVEGFNGFSGWLRFGNNGVIADNGPAEQEKMIKFTSLLASCVILQPPST
ncbi:Tn3 family transposase [Streptosporangium sp. NPDC023825]|uniref:Tn3 family transposase n=1 Tax=Streptosporangium sp. NPDC023825 TaxID=3154909 RepID=UPI00343810B2